MKASLKNRNFQSRYYDGYRREEYLNNSLYITVQRISIIFKYYNPGWLDEKHYDSDDEYDSNGYSNNDNRSSNGRHHRRSSRGPKYSDNAKNSNTLLLEMLIVLWPDLQKLLMLHKNNEIIMEKTSRIFKHTIRRNYEAFMKCDICGELLNLMTNLYLECPRSSFLYIITIYVHAYANINNIQLNSMLKQVLFKLTEKTFSKLENNIDFRNEPDIVEDYYELLIQYIKKCPHLLVESNSRSLQSLIANNNNNNNTSNNNNNNHNNNGMHFFNNSNKFFDSNNGINIELNSNNVLIFTFIQGFKGIMLEHKKAAQAVHSFYNYFIRMSNCRAQHSNDMCDYHLFVKNMLSEFGEEFVMYLCRGIAAGVRWQVMTDFLLIFENFYKFNKHYFKELFEQGLKNLSISTEDPTKKELISQFFRSDNESRHRRSYLEDFYIAAERYYKRITF